ncbi:hypothetical protein Oweho_0905 [Owenweeksia hongkongensis DSM 17368]|uniref:Uncharacterized protein n=1 Tax=Owenweeksia hongkongensis (strain DSM 17368 / CIP 108786 / JCM 12287 / NRRL B-23963 / UST20020801) TaxID=926562 RepID=G8R395_OWEHD|nr:hypothetical protein [Owenweeksia hongkongensis]AEV31916.1 hypothetical protein Oweho_0905 [Owenweeksia hongkongensis DSM 17368]
MEYSRAQIIDQYFQQIESGEMSFSQMRPSLQDMGVENEEISITVKQVDKQLQQSAHNKASHSLGKNIFYGGLLFAAIGLIITIGTFFGIIDIGPVFIVAYGPVISGSAIAATGFAKMNRGT